MGRGKEKSEVKIKKKRFCADGERLGGENKKKEVNGRDKRKNLK